LDDERLEGAIRALQQNRRDADAWETFYRVLYPFVFGSLFRIVRGNRYLAEECVQEVMMRVLKNFEFEKGVTPASVMTYLHQTMRSVVVDLRRLENRQPQFAEVDTADFNELEERLSTGGEADFVLGIKFEQALARLNEREATTIRLLADGGTVRDLEGLLNISKQTAYRLIAQARRRLREILFENDEKKGGWKRMS
jgi:RNA polymerase sigma factor (sigma-70 family)